MIPAHITRLMTFAQYGEPKAYSASDMMRNDLETLIKQAISDVRPTVDQSVEGDERIIQFMAILHAHIPEEQRPKARMDFSDDQWLRACAAFEYAQKS